MKHWGENMINTKIVDTKIEIINILNGLEVPIVVKQMMLQEIKQAFDIKTQEVLQLEKEED